MTTDGSNAIDPYRIDDRPMEATLSIRIASMTTDGSNAIDPYRVDDDRWKQRYRFVSRR
jgi:hypothetical protein